MKVPFSYLERQFRFAKPGEKPELADRIFEDLKEFVQTGDFTLGKKMEEFESKFAQLIGVRHAIGVNSGTDALMLSLKALGIGAGDEVITSAETFIATAGAIAGAGARPVFVDVGDDYLIDPDLIEQAITPKTRALMPVHFTGNCPDMDKIMSIARKHNLPVIEDSCCAIDASINGKKAGSIGLTGSFSFHPLKNLNVWSDGGMVTTHSDEMAAKIRLLRNHGMVNRDEIESFGLNSRLDTFQAVVALRMIDEVNTVTNRRIANANRLGQGLSSLVDFVHIPARSPSIRHVYHLYMVRVRERERLLAYCRERGVDAKVHYPIPLPYQKCCVGLGYKKGDFPKTERDAASIITFPTHQYLTNSEIDYTAEVIRNFYNK